MTTDVHMVVTNGEGQGLHFDIPCSLRTSFADLQDKLQKKFGHKDIKLYLEGSGCQPLCHQYVAARGSQLVLKSIVPSFCIPVSVTNYGQEISLRVRSIGKNSILVKIHVTDTIEMLKAVIESKLGIPTQEQVLKLVGTLAAIKNRNTVESLGLTSYSTVEVSMMLKGGSQGTNSTTCLMVDLFNQNAQRDVQIISGPPWRTISPGFTMVGFCSNARCEAFKLDVLCNKGFGCFDLSRTVASCPMCKINIKAINMYFSDCFYSIRAVEASRMDEKILPWTRVGHYGRTWDPKEAQTKSWSFMQIITRSLDRSMPIPGNAAQEEAPISLDCCICFGELNISENSCMLLCSHSLHTSCLNNWKEHETRNGRIPLCPLCRSVIKQ